MADFDTVLEALTTGANALFKDVASDVNKQVVPALAALSRSVVAIGADLAAGDISQERARIEFGMARRAAQAWIVAFVEATLARVEQLLNAVIQAASQAINGAVGFALV
jgi:hypothetical protein